MNTLSNKIFFLYLSLLFVMATSCTQQSAADILHDHILEVRGEPLRSMEGLTEIYLADFGAKVNDGANDLFAIQAAINEIRKMKGKAILIFEEGSYDIELDPKRGRRQTAVVLPVKGISNLIIDGKGAELIIKDPHIKFSDINRSEKVIIRNFTIDYDPLPFSQGTIVNIDPGTGYFEVQADEGYPPFDTNFFVTRDSWGMIKDPEYPGKLKQGVRNHLWRTACNELENGNFGIQLKNDPTYGNFDFLEVGDRYVQIARFGVCGMNYFSNEVTYENITYHACPGILFGAVGTSKLNILNCRALLKDDRLASSTSDAIHCQSSRIGPWVENCEFEGLSDDCLNIYTPAYHITKVVNETTLEVKHAERIEVGDSLAFFRVASGALEKVAVRTKAGDKIILSDPVKNLNIAPEGSKYDNRDWKKYDHAYNLNATGNYFVYKNNYLHDNRRYGAFIKASYGIIEGNTFERQSDNALTIENEPMWPEGCYAQNLVIRDNIIENCAFNGEERLSVIIDWQKFGFKSSDIPMQKNIFFEDNTIRTDGKLTAKFSNVDGITIRGNTFDNGSDEGVVVSIKNCKIIDLSDNVNQDRIQID